MTLTEVGLEPDLLDRDAAMLSGGEKQRVTIARALLSMDDAAYRTTFRGSATRRAKRRGLARNAAVVLGNIGNPGDADVLAAALEDPEPMVREHAAWALARVSPGANAKEIGL